MTRKDLFLSLLILFLFAVLMSVSASSFAQEGDSSPLSRGVRGVSPSPTLEKGDLLPLFDKEGYGEILRKNTFTLEVTDNLINLHAEQASFKEILSDLEKKTGIKVNIFEGVDDKKVNLNISALPVYAILARIIFM